MPLDNPAENPCYGCGPQVTRGLQLNFERRRAPDGVEEVVTQHTPRADEIGWPGFLHHGLHFAVLYEASYWAALELTGHVANSEGPATYENLRLPRTGKPFHARARILARETEAFRIRAVSESSEGKPLGSLETTWRHVSRARMEKLGLNLPDYLWQDMRP